jgi:hypothetical protein
MKVFVGLTALTALALLSVTPSHAGWERQPCFNWFESFSKYDQQTGSSTLTPSIQGTGGNPLIIINSDSGMGGRGAASVTRDASFRFIWTGGGTPTSVQGTGSVAAGGALTPLPFYSVTNPVYDIDHVGSAAGVVAPGASNTTVTVGGSAPYLDIFGWGYAFDFSESRDYTLPAFNGGDAWQLTASGNTDVRTMAQYRPSVMLLRRLGGVSARANVYGPY